MRLCFSVLLAMLLATPAFARPDACNAFDGAAVVSRDGDYIGKISGKFDPDSIFNQFGTYGSKFSTTSVWNKFGEYGGQYSDKSAFNKYASNAPFIVANGKVIAVPTANKAESGAVNPIVLAVTCYDYEPD